MARVTVEDCIDKVPNRFELVLLASHRARTISQGAPLTIDRDNDKNPVVALREIADETVEVGDLREDLVRVDGLDRYDGCVAHGVPRPSERIVSKWSRPTGVSPWTLVFLPRIARIRSSVTP